MMTRKRKATMRYRIEKDSLGEIKVPENHCWGAQTQRSLLNFPIGTEKIPYEIILAFAYLKKAAALTNMDLGELDPVRAETIADICDDILRGKYKREFPLSVWQTGSGTQSNMNVNEVISHLGNARLADSHSEVRLHPNDHVNRGQSSNDTFPTAMHIAAILTVKKNLLPKLRALKNCFRDLSEKNKDIVKIGRTHLQDATPLTLGQEISAWASMLEHCEQSIHDAMKPVYELALGGTAVGTGLNAHPDFAVTVASKIAQYTKEPFVTAGNKFYALTSKDSLAALHGALKALAADLMKIANDIRMLSSGPRCGIGELIIPANEPGSSIMPGKVNPTQCESLTMIAAQVLGNDVTIGIAASQGNYQLNVFMPVLIYNFIQSVRLLGDGMASFTKRCASGIQPNLRVINKNVEQSLMLVTALSPVIGYEKAATVAKYAYSEGISLKEAAVTLGAVTEEEFSRIVDPAKMV